MNWQSRYIPPDQNPWHGREDVPAGSCFFHRIKLINLLTQKLERLPEPAFAIVGFKCDEGTQRDLGRTGSVEGPLAIRQRLSKLPLQKQNIHLYDVGNITCTDHDLEASQAALADVVKMLLEYHIHPIVIGGGHELAYGVFQGIAAANPPGKRLGIISFDAHFNLHSMEPSHRAGATTVFYQIAKAHETQNRHFDYNCIGIQHAGNVRKSFDKAKNFHTKILYADELHQGQREKSFDFVDRVIDENDMVYVSLSLDVFSPAHAPGVSSTQPLGLNPWNIIPLIRQAAASGKVVCYDISEHVPRYDIDHRTAKLAASLIYEIVHHHNDNHRTP
ncbi:MAG TPA: formimidoylglutamase [Gammaproteobacteria bacterium]|jgi:formiminoglutamase|nr:formimidoylglutamase [Gammaproteobacteria bacterium]